jgi:hypothetical protein
MTLVYPLCNRENKSNPLIIAETRSCNNAFLGSLVYENCSEPKGTGCGGVEQYRYTSAFRLCDEGFEKVSISMFEPLLNDSEAG